MRGSDRTTGSLFSYVDIEQRVPAKHPLRIIKTIVDGAGGHIRVESPGELGEPRCGARFVVSLPAELNTSLDDAAPSGELLVTRSA